MRSGGGENMVLRLLVEQRKRLVASILGHAERTFWDRLTPYERDDLRAKVFEAVSVYTDFIRDVIRIVDEDQVRNERALDLIEALHDGQRAIAERLSQAGG